MSSSVSPAQSVVTRWLEEKLRNLMVFQDAGRAQRLRRAVLEQKTTQQAAQFINPFDIRDVLALDADTLSSALASGGVAPDDLAVVMRSLPEQEARLLAAKWPEAQRIVSEEAGERTPADEAQARRRVLDALFWELTYWHTPDLYDDLTAGETVHPGIFEQLTPRLRDAIALDAGAGSGRATFPSVEAGALHVYAAEPSPGLRRLLQRKVERREESTRVTVLPGRFDALPLDDATVDVALACSSFTRERESGGEGGLRELRRVTRPGGLIVIIWPRPEDFRWLAEQGFAYVALPVREEPVVRFRSYESAWRCASRFYGRNERVLAWLRETRLAEVPFSLVGANPPHDYCWLRVQ